MTGNATILLVEDNPDDEELILLSLERGGVANHIDVARDGAEALDYLLARGDYAGRSSAPLPVVVLLDLELPKLNGLEVLREIRANRRTTHLPVVVLTSSAHQRDIVESYNLGANSFVQKPVLMEEFSAAVQRLGFYWLLINRGSPGASES